ncbi:hypothetical protein D3C81_2130630 [compost metagenome]
MERGNPAPVQLLRSGKLSKEFILRGGGGEDNPHLRFGGQQRPDGPRCLTSGSSSKLCTVFVYPDKHSTRQLGMNRFDRQHG